MHIVQLRSVWEDAFVVSTCQGQSEASKYVALYIQRSHNIAQAMIVIAWRRTHPQLRNRRHYHAVYTGTGPGFHGHRHLAMAMTDATAANVEAQQPSSSTALPPLTMQIVVRRDLLEADGWGLGPLMAQVAHATAAVLHETRGRAETVAYLEDLQNMRKAVLQTADEASLKRLSDLLQSSNPPIPYHLWIEQPENIPTCIALAPNRRENKIKKALDKSGARLWKG
ncbi:peptidyl-tRNA hydrolase II domain-containing protein [Cytidiella melzeri]|nr:peptidyl-tRNA hydrolase II domain-containing protein [Cytidiella melzeri]